jgi:replication initiator protein A
MPLINSNDKADRAPLLPDRHPEPDFFFCDIFDATPKSDMASMENPLFTLSTKPDMTQRVYRTDKIWLKLQPSPIGLATVFDRDILIYCISQCMAALSQGRDISRTVRFNAHDLLKTTNRQTNKKGYDLLRNALQRLQGTQIETNITMGGQEQWEVFSFIESAKTLKKTRDGRMQAIEVTLSDWVFNAINEKGKDLLTISKDYFRLRKPLERRLYELARKMCGQGGYWHLKLETIHQRTGSTSTQAEFKRLIRSIIDDNKKHNHIPDYTFDLIDELVTIRPKSEFTELFTEALSPSDIGKIQLNSSTYEVARKFAGRYDIHFLEREWRFMLQSKNAMPENPDGSFMGFIKWYVENNGAAAGHKSTFAKNTNGKLPTLKPERAARARTDQKEKTPNSPSMFTIGHHIKRLANEAFEARALSARQLFLIEKPDDILTESDRQKKANALEELFSWDEERHIPPPPENGPLLPDDGSRNYHKDFPYPDDVSPYEDESE